MYFTSSTKEKLFDDYDYETLFLEQRTQDVTGYDDVRKPTMPGSAGTRGSAHVNDIGGAGGGAVSFEASKLFTLDGIIDTSGNQGQGDYADYRYLCGGGGAGGSIYIKAESFAGAGVAKANARLSN